MFTMIPYRPGMENRMINPFDDDFFRPFFGRPERGTFRVDIKDNGDSYLLEAEAPGVAKENIHIDLENDVLTISVEQNEANEKKNNEGYVLRERRTGRMSRAFSVEGIRKEDIRAAYQDGVLQLTLPKEKPEEMQVKHAITID